MELSYDQNYYRVKYRNIDISIYHLSHLMSCQQFDMILNQIILLLIKIPELITDRVRALSGVGFTKRFSKIVR